MQSPAWPPRCHCPNRTFDRYIVNDEVPSYVLSKVSHFSFLRYKYFPEYVTLFQERVVYIFPQSMR
jgi:hypothetical protein